MAAVRYLVDKQGKTEKQQPPHPDHTIDQTTAEAEAHTESIMELPATQNQQGRPSDRNAQGMPCRETHIQWGTHSDKPTQGVPYRATEQNKITKKTKQNKTKNQGRSNPPDE